MKKRFCHILFFFFAGQLSGQTSAAAYLAAVDGQLKQVHLANREYVKAATGKRPAKAEKQRQALLQKIRQASGAIGALPAWRSSAALRDSAVTYLGISEALLTEDYGRVANLAPIAENSFDAIEAFIAARQLVQQQLSNAAQGLETAYSEFAEQNQLQLKTEPALNRELNDASRALIYYDRIYQVFFTSYKQEAYLLDAIAQGDVSAIGQNREALERTSAAGLQQLESMHDFGDNPIRSACRRLLTFYHSEASETLAGAARHFVQQDDLQKQARAVTNLRGEKEHAATRLQHEETKEELLRHHEEFSRQLAGLSRRRHALMVSWQKAADQFLRKNVK